MVKGIKQEYYNWLCDFIKNKKSYKKLLRKLYTIEYYYTIELNENILKRGLSLRDRFAYEMKYPYNHVECIFEDKPGSVLEVLVSLALDCEERIMGKSEYGNRTSKWFWEMIKSINLIDMTDDKYDVGFVEKSVEDLLSGKIGFLYSKKKDKELWIQTMDYLNNELEKERE